MAMQKPAAPPPCAFIVLADSRVVRAPLSSFEGPAPYLPLACLRDYCGATPSSTDELVKDACYFADVRASASSSPAGSPTSAAGLPINLGFDEVMLRHVSPSDRYPERPQRLAHAARLLRDEGFLTRTAAVEGGTDENEECPGDGNAALEHAGSAVPVKARPATWDEIRRVHPSPAYEAFCGPEGTIAFGDDVISQGDMHIAPDGSTREAALVAAGTCVEAAAAVLDAKHRDASSHAFCLVRPPGHHCGQQPSGFCVLNNVMVALSAAVTSPAMRALVGAERLPRVAIVDIDVHHGDGTQTLVDKWNADPERAADILFVSTHRYDSGTFFPKSGHPTSTGAASTVSCVNIGFNTDRKRNAAHTMCDDTFDVVDWHLLRPMFGKSGPFAPDLVFLSCGFDAAEGDPLGGQAVVRGFHRVARSLAVNVPSSAGVVAVLEGGYNVEAVAQATLRVVRSLDRPMRDPGPPVPALPWVQQSIRLWSAAGEEPRDGDGPVEMPAAIRSEGVRALKWSHRAWALRTILHTAEALAAAGGAAPDSALAQWAATFLVPRLTRLLEVAEAPMPAVSPRMDRPAASPATASTSPQ
jgi:acetoin utilization deacetylase AcuC-like enzyme